ncbi:MAG: RIP metalloprotease RseP, partial [Planctomycetota bacterium]|nr:RIP metalloprotease RseP [Planctomycetota bacterium]
VTGAPDEFTSKSVGARTLIAAAGVMMNLFTGLLIFCLAFAVGVKFMLPQLGEVPLGSQAYAAGLRDGDKVISVDGKPVSHFEQVGLAIAYSAPDQEIEMVVEREDDGVVRRHKVVFTPKKNKTHGIPMLQGLTPGIAAQVFKVEGDSAASKAVLASDGSPYPLRRGDLILSIAGVPIDPLDGNAVRRGFFDNPDRDIPVTIRRGMRIRTSLEKDEGRYAPTLSYEGGKDVEVVIHPKAKYHHHIGAYPAELPTVSGEVTEGAPAYGLIQKGDQILRVEGKDARTHSFRRAIRFSAGRPVEVEILRDGQEQKVTLTPRFARGTTYQVGVPFAGAMTVGQVDSGSAADQAGLRPGDLITKIDYDEKIDDEKEILTWLAVEVIASAGKKMTLTVQREAGDASEIIEIEVKPLEDKEHSYGQGGIGLGRPTFALRSENLLEATKLGIGGTVDWVRNILLTFRNIFNRQVSPKNLGGPVMIAQASYRFATQGFGTILYFLGIISINLAILNVLPIPVLDGGMLFFLAIEKIKGSPVQEKYMIIANYFGLALLLSLMLYVTFNDIMRIFSG